MNSELLVRVRARRAAIGGNVWWLNHGVIDCWSYPTAMEAERCRARLVAEGHTVFNGQYHPINGGLLIRRAIKLEESTDDRA